LKTQFKQLENTIYRWICNPAMMSTFIFGFAMIAVQPEYMKQPWLHVKILLVLLLMSVHLYMKKIKSKMDGNHKKIGFSLRLLLVILILFLTAIVSLAVFKISINYLFWLLGLFGVGLITTISTAKLQTPEKGD